MSKLTKEEEKEVNRLVKLLKDDRESLRYHIALMLGLMGSKAKGAIPALIEMLQKDKERTVRYQAARALGLIREKPKQTVPALSEAMKDRDWMVRKAAAWSLGWLGKEGKGAIEALIEAMNAEENKENKFTFALSLARIERREGEGIPVLRRMQEEEELADWELFLFEDLSRELALEEKVSEVKKEAVTVRKAVEREEKRKALTSLETIEKHLSEIFVLLKREPYESTIQLQNYLKAIGEFKEKESWWDKWRGEVIVGIIGAVATIIAIILGITIF